MRACVNSFEGAVQSLAGRSTHAIFAEQGTIRADIAESRKHLVPVGRLSRTNVRQHFVFRL